jgi:FtsH-binding integral membrane protein
MSCINEILKDWGFLNSKDYVKSMAGHITYPTISIGGVLGLIATSFEKIIGMDLVMYFAFILLLLVELRTGIVSSKRAGNKYQSKRAGRFILKAFTYTVVLGVVNIFYTRLSDTKMGFLYEVIYWSILHLIVLQLIVSVFENLSKMGFAESSKVFKKINQILDKYFNLDVKVEKEEKEENK